MRNRLHHLACLVCVAVLVSGCGLELPTPERTTPSMGAPSVPTLDTAGAAADVTNETIEVDGVVHDADLADDIPLDLADASDTALDVDLEEADTLDVIDLDVIVRDDPIVGFGADTTGGNGGTVIHVTNTDDAGTGSLREAVQVATGAREIVFDVTGPIVLTTGTLDIDDGAVTIDGSTAPSPGVVIVGGIRVRSSNVLLRHLRVRPGATGAPGIAAALRVGDGVRDVVVDHCSVSWFGDEGFIANAGSTGTERMSVSWSLFADGFNSNACVGLDFECDGGAMTIRGTTTDATVHHNVFSNNYAANPRLSGQGQVEFVNNYVSGWVQGGHVSPDGDADLYVDFIGNLWRHPLESAHEVTPAQPGVGAPHIYLWDNLGPNRASDSDPQDAVFEPGFALYLEPGASVSPASVTPDPAHGLLPLLLPSVGATLPCRDTIDAAIVQGIANGDAQLYNSPTELSVSSMVECSP